MSSRKKSPEPPIWWDIIDCPWLAPAEKHLLIVVARKANKDGSNTKGVTNAVYAELSGYTGRYVTKTLKALTEKGYLKTMGMWGQIPIRHIQRAPLLEQPLPAPKKAKKGHDTTNIPSIPTLAKQLREANPLLTIPKSYDEAVALRRQLLEAEKGVLV